MAEISELADLIAKDLEGFYEDTDAEMQDIIDQVTTEALAEIKKNPIIPKRTGKYAKGFYKKTLARGRGYKRNAIGNKVYRLTHLLEHGHLTSNGKRTRAYPHWKETENFVKKRIEELTHKT